jgi:hypothetical protein
MNEYKLLIIGAGLILLGGAWEVINVLNGTWPFMGTWILMGIGAIVVIAGLFKLSLKLALWAMVMLLLAALMLFSLWWWS